ncbi:Quercetin 2,3-dioxygenase [compost metagenome]
MISKDGRNGSISIHQDADMYIAKLKKSEDLDFNLPSERRLWIQLIKGEVTVNGEKIQTGDAVSTQDVATATIKASEDSEMIIFELA